MLKHTLLTWLATCFLGTGLLCLYIGLAEGGFKDPYMEALVLLGLGITLLASIPSMIIYGLMLDALLRSMAPQQAKALCSGYAVIATVITYFISFGLIGGNFRNADGGLVLATIPFALCFALAPWIIPMPRSGREVVRDSVLFENPEIPSGTPPAYTVVAAIVGCLLLYSLVKLFAGRPQLVGGTMAVALIWHLLDIALMATALILFMRWIPAGWKLLTGLSAAGVTGSIISLAMTIGMVGGLGSVVTGFLVSMVIFMLAQGMALYLMSRPELRLRFRVTTRDYGIWIIAGIGYAIVRTVLIRMMFGT